MLKSGLRGSADLSFAKYHESARFCTGWGLNREEIRPYLL